ncbi:MAG: DUF1573 domain-containing protein [Bacteroidales bacterium]
MKKFFLVLTTLMICLGNIYAQDVRTVNKESDSKQSEQKIEDVKISNSPYMEFDKLVHDYGTIPEKSDGKCIFVLTNTGKEPLILNNIRSTCGCTVPKWEKAPILPGQSTEIEVKYATNRIGKINKSVTVTSNAENSPIVLKIVGEVVKESPKQNFGKKM